MIPSGNSLPLGCALLSHRSFDVWNISHRITQSFAINITRVRAHSKVRGFIKWTCSLHIKDGMRTRKMVT